MIICFTTLFIFFFSLIHDSEFSGKLNKSSSGTLKADGIKLVNISIFTHYTYK